MLEEKENILALVKEKVLSVENKMIFNRYSQMKEETLDRYVSNLYHLLLATVRSGDRKLLIDYMDEISMRRFAEGFEPAEICSILMTFSDLIVENLILKNKLGKYRQEINDYVSMSIQIASDEIEDLYEKLFEKVTLDEIADLPLKTECKELEHQIKQLAAFYQVLPEEQNKNERNLKRELK
jgi:hypothetical protein